MENNIDLSGLKGLHFPTEPDLFPLALGWWLVLIATLLGLAVAIRLFFYVWFNPKRQALRELSTIYQNKKSDGTLYAKEVSKLLKRIALFRFGRDKVATLSDTQWASFLQQVGGHALSAKQAKLIATAAYLPPHYGEKGMPDEMNPSVKKWINYVLRRK